MEARCFFRNGLFDGFYERHYSNGQLQRRYFYKDGIKDGPYIEYWIDGQFVRSGVYRQDEELQGYEADEYLKHWKKEFNKKQERIHIDQQLKQLDKNMPPTYLRQIRKRALVTDFRQKYEKVSIRE